MEVVGHGKKKVIWGVVDDHVLEEPTDHEEIAFPLQLRHGRG